MGGRIKSDGAVAVLDREMVKSQREVGISLLLIVVMVRKLFGDLNGHVVLLDDAPIVPGFEFLVARVDERFDFEVNNRDRLLALLVLRLHS